MPWVDIIILVVVIIGAAFAGLYFLNRWSSKQMANQQRMIASTSQSVSIYVIDKKKDRLKNVNLPKAVVEQMPKRASLMKMPLVKAKVGPQIVTLIADKKVYEALPLNKNTMVNISGIYITSMKKGQSR